MANQQIVNSVSSSSSVVSLKKYDVFLSFRGEDTRNNFTSHLHDALTRKKVETYIDYRLEKGDEISQALIKAIQDSLVSVVIFSENYASSKWCLDEISVILQCKRDHGQIVIPVFYKVDPSDVRKQTGSYKEAFAKHQQDLNNSDDMLVKWRCALNEAASLAGWDSQNFRSESELTKGIVKDVLQKLNNRYPIDQLKGVVGIEGNYAKVESLLDIGSNEVRVIGIWGMGGLGKTTLARALYAKLYIQFEGHCFLKSVREQSEKDGLDALRNILFSELLSEKNLHVESHNVMRRLARKKVLIILDDVATSKQLTELITDYNCLASGSRVIVTTRDKHIISQVDGIYEVKELNAHDSLQLFCSNAFNEMRPKMGYEELSNNVIAYCKGNPLALKVLGARLLSKSIEEWNSELRKLHKIPDANIHKVLKLSFDDLDRTEQNIFLDIACFLKGFPRNYITFLLDACDFYAVAGIANLINKSLITLSNEDKIEMHDLIQEIGWEIVRQESIKYPGRRSRLWRPEEVYDVLKNNKGSEVVECIVLDVSKINKDLHLNFNPFTKMTEVRIIIFFSSKWDYGSYKIYLHNGLESLPDKLRYLEWPISCLECFPSTFCPEMLVELRMRNSSFKKLWGGVQNLLNLKIIDLGYSKDLVELPDLSQATKLEVLLLDECISLCEVHPSILSLHKLRYLRLEGCTQIESLEFEVHSKSLKGLNLRNCTSLKKFSVFSEELEDLRLDFTKIHELPSVIWRCEKLKEFTLRNCYNLKSFTVKKESNLESFASKSKSSRDSLMGSLRFLDLGGCKLLNEFSLRLILDGMVSLTVLYLHNCSNLRALPDSIGSLTSLVDLDLSGCINVEMLSPNIKNLLKLEELRLDNCRKLVSLPELSPSLKKLKATNCLELRALPDMKNLLKLEGLWLDNCRKLVSLPEIPPSLELLKATNCLELRALPDMRNLLKLEGLWLDNCRKLVSLPELPPTLERFSVINCTSLQQIDLTQLLLLVNINVCYVILPGDQVPDMFRFHAKGDSITLPHLPHSCRISGFICCFILSHLPPDGICGRLYCYINKRSTPIQASGGYMFASHGSMADHVLLCFLDKKKILQGWACDSNSMRFEFYFMKGEKIKINIEIKRCGVVPVYSSQDLEPTILTGTQLHMSQRSQIPLHL